LFGRFRLFCRLGATLAVSAAILGVMVTGGGQLHLRRSMSASPRSDYPSWRHERHRVLGRMSFESPCVDMHRLSVWQNLSVFARLYGVTDTERKIARLAEDLALFEFLDRASGTLSVSYEIIRHALN
jgi:hypothetical protein